MIIKPKNTDYEDIPSDDDFEDIKIPATKKEKEPKKPVLTPENPEYWEEEEDEFEHIKRSRRLKDWRLWFFIAGVGVVFGILWAVWIQLAVPAREGVIQYGYIESMESHHGLFSTFEGKLMPYKSLADTVAPYEGDLYFSVNNDHLAANLKRLMIANLPARIEYREYRTRLPWRGETTILITHVDTADPRKIYPPHLNHDLIPVSTKKTGTHVSKQ